MFRAPCSPSRSLVPSAGSSRDPPARPGSSAAAALATASASASTGPTGWPQHGRDYKQILHHYYRHTSIGTGQGLEGEGPADVGRLLGRLQRRQEGMRPLGLARQELRVRRLGIKRLAPQPPRPLDHRRAGTAAARAAAARSTSPVRATIAASSSPTPSRRRPLRRQPGQHRGLRQGRDPERDAGQLGPAGASRPGSGRSLLRARDQAVGPLRPLRRHPQPGLRRQGHGAGRPPTGRRGPRPAGSSSTTARSRSPTSSRPPEGTRRTSRTPGSAARPSPT